LNQLFERKGSGTVDFPDASQLHPLALTVSASKSCLHLPIYFLTKACYEPEWRIP